jgi:hypothetical protein
MSVVALRNKKKFSTAKLREKEDLRREFEGYLARYREIMADRAATKAKEAEQAAEVQTD